MFVIIEEMLYDSGFSMFIFLFFPISVFLCRLLYRAARSKEHEKPFELIKNSLKCILIAYIVLIIFAFLAESGILETICMLGEGIVLLLLPLVFLGI